MDGLGYCLYIAALFFLQLDPAVASDGSLFVWGPRILVAELFASAFTLFVLLKTPYSQKYVMELMGEEFIYFHLGKNSTTLNIQRLVVGGTGVLALDGGHKYTHHRINGAAADAVAAQYKELWEASGTKPSIEMAQEAANRCANIRGQYVPSLATTAYKMGRGMIDGWSEK